SERIGIERSVVAGRFRLQPMMVKFDPQHVEAVEAERVDVAVADPRPVAKLDAELVGGVGRPDEITLVEAEQGVEQVDLRDRRFADADGPDLVRFNQFDRKLGQLAKNLGHGCCSHPPRRSAADDHDRPDAVGFQKTISSGSGADGGVRQLAMNSSWVGRRAAVSRMAIRICSSASATLRSSSPSTTGSYSSGTMPWPSITDTQLVTLNNSASAKTRALLRN